MRIEFGTGAPGAYSGTALLLPVGEGEALPAAILEYDLATGGQFADAWSTGRIRGRVGETAVARASEATQVDRVILLGVGRLEHLDGYRLRNALALAGEVIRRAGAPRLGVLIPGELEVAGDPGSLVRAVVEGLVLGQFDRVLHRSTDPAGSSLETATLFGLASQAGLAELAEEALQLGEATNLARRLQATAGNLLTPTDLEREARELAERHGLEFRALGVPELEAAEAGAILAVGRGSVHPPRLLELRYRPAHPIPGVVLGLVGKGVTFDSGGLSLKTLEGMQRMNYDMSGSAAVLGAMQAIAQRRPPVEVLAICPVVENMVSGDAFRVGDVLTTMSGKTVEIISTDAEGRLILADALTHAVRQGATHLVDAATLTGQIKLALGHICFGAFSSDVRLMRALAGAALSAGERVWEMPMYPDYELGLRSQLADLKNSHGRPGGSISAAFFLRQFIEGRPWVHLDIAGAAWNDHTDLRSVAQGPTGVPTRTLAHLPWKLAAQLA